MAKTHVSSPILLSLRNLALFLLSCSAVVSVSTPCLPLLTSSTEPGRAEERGWVRAIGVEERGWRLWKRRVDGSRGERREK
jgi:hypothetical protein